MKTTKLMTGLALVASTLLTTAPVLAQDQTKDSIASLTIKPGVRNVDSVSTLSFDNVTVSGNTAVTSNTTVAIKLSDYTCSLSGWQLKVKRSDFAEANDSSTKLDGVTLTLTEGGFDQSSSDDVDTTKDTVKADLELGTDNVEVATAGTGTGTGSTTINYDGATLKLSEEIAKEIAKGKVKVGTYRSTLTWTLTDAPTQTN